MKNKKLTGLREIACYLGVTVRTVTNRLRDDASLRAICRKVFRSWECFTVDLDRWKAKK